MQQIQAVHILKPCLGKLRLCEWQNPTWAETGTTSLMAPTLIRGVQQGLTQDWDCPPQDSSSYWEQSVLGERSRDVTAFRVFDKQGKMGYIIMTLTPDPLIVRVHEAFPTLAAFCKVMFEETLG